MAMEEPRKPQTAYWIFLGANREKLTSEAGSARGPVVGKFAGERWKGMTPAEKAPYEKKAQEAKEAYERDMAKFKEQGGVVGKRRQEKAEAKKDREGKKSRKRDKDPNKPKKPQTACWLWLSDNRAALQKEVGKNDITLVAKLGGEKWRAMPEKDKAPYEQKAAELKATYNRAMEEYKQTVGEDVADEEEENSAEDN